VNDRIEGICLKQLNEEITPAQVTLNKFARQAVGHVAIDCDDFVIVGCQGQAHVLTNEATCAGNKYHRVTIR
jgi:hypothetical protein